jgi:outer membrane receptor protein involved in Fe transport
MPKADPRVVNYDPGVGPYPSQAYATLNLRLGLLRDRWDLSAFVNNVTNADPRLSYYHAEPGDTLYYAIALRPLTAGLTALYRF